ncbi:MAG TPA: hypothetical protein VFS13_00735 [Steroidobacteraceae bacterium]|nr:hypothetical protein [Steroidobacteraceae bacterium]
MPAQLCRTEATQALAKVSTLAFACETAGVSDPAEIGPAFNFARTSELYFRALSQYRRACREHGRFAASHGDDDPAHDEHQERIRRAKATLNAAEVEYKRALAGWRESRGLGAEVES